MQNKEIIQQSLFAINNETNPKKQSNDISENLSIEELKKESERRPRPRKDPNQLIEKINAKGNAGVKND